jgi:hypothetical protein
MVEVNMGSLARDNTYLTIGRICYRVNTIIEYRSKLVIPLYKIVIALLKIILLNKEGWITNKSLLVLVTFIYTFLLRDDNNDSSPDCRIPSINMKMSIRTVNLKGLV